MADNEIISNGIRINVRKDSGRRFLTIDSVEPHTGREERKALFLLDGSEEFSYLKSTNDLLVTQNGSSLFGVLSPLSQTVAYNTTSVTITGESNQENLKVVAPKNATISGGYVAGVNMTSTMKAALTSAKGYTVVGSDGKLDPGAKAKYSFKIIFSIPANMNESDMTYNGSIGYGSTMVQFSFTQKGEVPVYVPPGEQDSDTPIIPDEPDIPPVPDTPDEPDVPPTPVEPDTPDTPDEPDEPDVPTPDTPVNRLCFAKNSSGSGNVSVLIDEDGYLVSDDEISVIGTITTGEDVDDMPWIISY